MFLRNAEFLAFFIFYFFPPNASCLVFAEIKGYEISDWTEHKEKTFSSCKEM